MTEVGLRELRQNASDVIRRVEAGEHITVTVSGRAAAQLSPAGTRRWRRYTEVVDVLSGSAAPDLADDLAALDGGLSDPFAR
jgi:prevent-host-death family protein